MRGPRQRGSVVLVALSCVTVLGIAMASFLAVSNQAMKFSNRSYAKAVSKQLAEMGLERALRSFNAGTFTSGWTLTGGTTATRSLTIASSHYGNSGITATVNIRVEHYLSTRKATLWNEWTTYTANDFVWYQGVWYLCTTTPPVALPQLPSDETYWKAAPETWNAQANYRSGNIALSGGSAYRCIAANIGQAPPNATYWTAYTVAPWSAATAYAINTVVFSGGLPYRCIAANTNQEPPNSSYWLSAAAIYAEGVATLPDNISTKIKTQLRATLGPAPLFPNAVAATTLVTFAGSGTVNSYNSSLGVYGGSNIGSSAVVAGGNASSTAVAITNVRVNGYLAALSSTNSPYAPQYTNSTSGIVTSVAAPTIPATKIDSTRISRSPYIPQFDIQTVTGAINLPSPSSGSTLADGTTTALGVAGAVRVYNITRSMAGSSTYYSGLYLADADDIITIDGHVILNVTGTYFGMGDGKIVIKAGGSLEIFSSSATQMYLGTYGSGGIDNSVTKDPSKVLIASNHATNTLNYHYLQSTVLPFYGTIYMPNAYLTVASDNIPIYGAISAKNVNFTAVANFHYDTSLRTAGAIGTFIDAPYKVTEWRELTDPDDKITLP